MTVVEAILAFFVPPLAVALKKGISRQFWICLLLTVLGHIPGVIYALVITTSEA